MTESLSVGGSRYIGRIPHAVPMPRAARARSADRGANPYNMLADRLTEHSTCLGRHGRPTRMRWAMYQVAPRTPTGGSPQSVESCAYEACRPGAHRELSRSATVGVPRLRMTARTGVRREGDSCGRRVRVSEPGATRAGMSVRACTGPGRCRCEPPRPPIRPGTCAEVAELRWIPLPPGTMAASARNRRGPGRPMARPVRQEEKSVRPER